MPGLGLHDVGDLQRHEPPRPPVPVERLVAATHDQEAPPQPAIGINIGDSLILRYDESQREVVGLTVLGLRDRLVRGLGGKD